MKEMNSQDSNKLPLSLARAALTDADWRFLRIVHLAGGYALREPCGRAPTARLGRCQLPTTAGARLDFLTRVDLFTNPSAPRIYKLTARALRCLGDRHSHIRREHSERTVLYKLLRLQFICEQQKAARVTSALSQAKKRALFAQSGFCPEDLKEENCRRFLKRNKPHQGVRTERPSSPAAVVGETVNPEHAKCHRGPVPRPVRLE